MDADHVGPGRVAGVRARLRELYHGQTPTAVRFRLSVIGVDLILIAFFIATPILRGTSVFLALDYAIAAVLVVELAARLLALPDIARWWARTSFWLDLVVLATLLFPQWLFSLAFLRVIRIWTLFNSDFFWETVGRRYDDTRTEEVVRALATLITFVFLVTGLVYASYARRHPGIEGYVDALYFTVTTLTTTGFGDVVLPGVGGKLLSILIMVAGITLFVRLAQPLFRPSKVRFPCPACGLLRHDPDAVHCKACGMILNIPNEE